MSEETEKELNKKRRRAEISKDAVVVLLNRLSDIQPSAPLKMMKMNMRREVSGRVESLKGCQLIDSEGNRAIELIVKIEQHSGICCLGGYQENIGRFEKEVHFLEQAIAKKEVFELDETLESLNGIEGFQNELIMAISIAAHRCCASFYKATPIDYMAPVEIKSLPIPVFTIIEGRDESGSITPPLFKEISLIVYSSSVMEGISLATKVTNNMTSALQKKNLIVASQHHLGSRGGVIVRSNMTEEEFVNLISILSEQIELVFPSASVDLKNKQTSHQRLKVSVQFHPTSVSSAVSGSIHSTMSLGDQIHVVVDPYQESDVLKWKTIKRTGVLLATDQSPLHKSCSEVIVTNMFAFKTLSEMSAFRSCHPDSLFLLKTSESSCIDVAPVQVAIALQFDFINLGGVQRGERTAHWNELIRMEEYLLKLGRRPFPQILERWI